MSGKAKKEERKAEAAATVASDPQALLKGQLALVRMDGAIEGLEAGVKITEGSLKTLQEGLGALKSDRRKLAAEVERMQKAAGIDGKSPPPADGAQPAEAAPAA